jgi:hypothetical protein
MQIATEKENILDDYIFLAKSRGNRYPSSTELKKFGVTEGRVKYHFGSYTELFREAKEEYPEFFNTIIDIDSLRCFKPTKKRLVITSAIAGANVHAGFLASMKNYCKKNNAELIVLPVFGNTYWKGSNGCTSLEYLDPVLSNENIHSGYLKLNNNISISSVALSPSQVDPITGFGRVGQRSGSLIFASPKQRMKPVAIANNKLPHVLMTTGACTMPEYGTPRKRSSFIANNDHVIGAIVVELQDSEIFHFRQIQSDKDGKFIDLGIEYGHNKTRRILPEAIVLGDLHAGETDLTALAAFTEVIKLLKPKRIVVHDGFSGKSINHHEANRGAYSAHKQEVGKANLSDELVSFGNSLIYLSKLANEVVVVKSNHDEFLERYLDSGRYIKDPQNYAISAQLAYGLIKQRDPIVEGLNLLGYRFPPKKVKFLQRDDDYRVAGVQLAAHGDIGPHGSRGSAKNIEDAYGSCIVGHHHTPEILRGVWVVGTLSLFRLGYNKGPSSWLHTSAILYPNGQKQLINMVEGKWRI